MSRQSQIAGRRGADVDYVPDVVYDNPGTRPVTGTVARKLGPGARTDEVAVLALQVLAPTARPGTPSTSSAPHPRAATAPVVVPPGPAPQPGDYDVVSPDDPNRVA